MNWSALFLLIAFLIFCFAAWLPEVRKIQLVSLGLAFLSLSMLVATGVFPIS